MQVIWHAGKPEVCEALRISLELSSISVLEPQRWTRACQVGADGLFIARTMFVEMDGSPIFCWATAKKFL